jgi:hypothetical protein
VQPIHFQGTVQTAWRAVPVTMPDPMPANTANFQGTPASATPHYA